MNCEYVWTLTMTPKTCLTWTKTWSMWTRTRTPTEDSWVLFVLLCLFRVVLVWFFAHHTKAQGSSELKDSNLSLFPSHGHRHVSCARWLTVFSTSPSTSLSFSSSSLASRTSFCSSLSLRKLDNSHAHCLWGVGFPLLQILLHNRHTWRWESRRYTCLQRRIPEGLLRPLFVSPRRKEGPPCIWDTHGISGNVFANPHASSSAP